MAKILGLDLGTNSIGWAVIEDGKKILGTGARIFPEGVKRDTQGKEESKNATRREKRQLRRQTYRRKMRKMILVKELMQHGMFPKIENIKEAIQDIVLSEQLKQYFSANPYELRAKASKGEKLSLIELGRVLYQFAQRRGYKEDLQSDDNTKESKNPEYKLKKDIYEETKEKIYKTTLGNYLNSLDPHKERIRNRYLVRSMYLQEFEIIWEKQKKYYPEIITDDLKQKIGDATDGILFFKRDLRSQKHLLGKCTFEPSKTRCANSSILYEQFRMHQFINSIKYGEKLLNEEQRKIVVELLSSSSKDKIEFTDIKKKLKLSGENFNCEDKQKVIACKTISNFRKIFGKEEWDNKPIEEQEEIWHIKTTAKDREWIEKYAKEKWKLDDVQIKKFCDLKLAKDYSNLSRKAICNILPFLKKGKMFHEAVLLGGVKNAFGNEWNTIDEKKKDFIETTIGEITNNLDGKTKDNISKWLKEDFKFSDKQLKKLYHHSEVQKTKQQLDALPEPENIRNPIVQQALYELKKLVNVIIKEYGKPNEIRVELARELKSAKKERDKIRIQNWENETENDKIKIRLDEYKKPHTRHFIQKLKLFQELEKEKGIALCPYTGKTISISKLFNDGYVQTEHIIPLSVSLDDSLANKTLCVADENQKKGDQTPFQFYGKDNKHWGIVKERAKQLLPYRKYQRFISEKPAVLDEFIQRQLNDTRYISKSAKEYLKYITPNVTVAQGRATAMLRHWWGLDNIRNQKFEMPKLADDEYIVALDENNTILETSKWTKDHKKEEERLAKLGKVISGNVNKGVFYPYKTRDDHRHHAIDAITIACSKTSYLQKISKLTGRGCDEDKISKLTNFDAPWKSFWRDANDSVNNILVSYKNKSKVLTTSKKTVKKNGIKYTGKGIAARGQLHDATVYGRYENKDGEVFYHIRKPLESLTKKAQIDKIADRTIRKIIEDAIKKANPKIDLSKKYDVPDNTFFKTDDKGIKHPLVFLPNQNGEPIPIKKVRLKEVSSNAVKLKTNKEVNQWVEPGENHHIVIYEKENGKRDGIIVPFWVAVETKKEKLPVINTNIPDGKFIMALSKKDMILLDIDENEIDWNKPNYSILSNHLYTVRKLSVTGNTKVIVFTLHKEANVNADRDKAPFVQRKTPNSLNGIKVKISPTGKIFKA